MTNKTYRLIFWGEIFDGYDQQTAWDELSRTCKLSEEKLKRLLSKGKVAVLRKGLSAEEAFIIQDKFAAVGVKTHLKEEPEPISTFLLRGADTPAARNAPLPIKQTLDAVSQSPSTQPQNEFIFEFTGSGGEYFRIWIVNILLTIVTLGIYGAWAKVRNKQYLYGNTLLEGISFHYLAKPLMLLKGRLFALALLLIYLLLNQFYPIYGIGFILLLTLVFPFLAVRSLTFNARYSSYRNIRFDFRGTVGEAYMVFLVWPLLGSLSLGLLFPFALYKQQRFFVENSRYGTTLFEFTNSAGSYYKFIGLALLIMIVGMVFSNMALSLVHPALVIVGMFVTYLFVGAFFAVQMANALYNSTNLSDIYFSSAMDTPSYMSLYITNTLLMVVTLGLFYPWAKVRTMRYKASRITLAAQSDLDQFKAAVHDDVSATGHVVAEAFDMDIGL